MQRSTDLLQLSRGARRLAHEARNQLRQALGLVLGRECARSLDPFEPRVREVGCQPLSVLGLEEAVLARPRDQRRMLELLQMFCRLVRQAFVHPP